MKYIFECSKEDYSRLDDQISKVLDKRIELYSRAKLSGAWKVIDRFNSSKTVSQNKSNQRKKRYKFYGITFLIMGVLFILIGMMKPIELKEFLYYGLFLLLIGIIYMPSRPNKKRANKKTEKVIERLKSNNENLAGLKLLFDSNGMYSEDEDLILASEVIDNVIITNDVYFFIYSNTLIPLLKSDLLEVTMEEFEFFLKQVFDNKLNYVS